METGCFLDGKFMAYIGIPCLMSTCWEHFYQDKRNTLSGKGPICPKRLCGMRLGKKLGQTKWDKQCVWDGHDCGNTCQFYIQIAHELNWSILHFTWFHVNSTIFTDRSKTWPSQCTQPAQVSPRWSRSSTASPPKPGAARIDRVHVEASKRRTNTLLFRCANVSMVMVICQLISLISSDWLKKRSKLRTKLVVNFLLHLDWTVQSWTNLWMAGTCSSTNWLAPDKHCLFLDNVSYVFTQYRMYISVLNSSHSRWPYWFANAVTGTQRDCGKSEPDGRSRRTRVLKQWPATVFS